MKKLKLPFILTSLLLLSTISYGQKYTGLSATASSGNATAAVDDNMGSRWESEHEKDPQWLLVDLGETKQIGTIKIVWEGANAKNYTLSFSNDGTTFSDELSYIDKPAGARTDIIPDLNLNYRYIKMEGTERNTIYGYSIWEFEVYPTLTPELTKIEVSPKNASVILGNSQQFTAAGKDQINNDFDLTAPTTWNVAESGGAIDEDGVFTSTSKGIFTISATNSGITGSTTIEVLPSNSNLAIAAIATASSGDANQLNDNNLGTRWESEHKVDPQWVMLDFKTNYQITDLIIYWEGANAKSYFIENEYPQYYPNEFLYVTEAIISLSKRLSPK